MYGENESYLQSSAASRRLKHSSVGSNRSSLAGSKRKSTSRGSRRKSSSQRRKRQYAADDDGDAAQASGKTSQSYELFAGRHLRRIAAGGTATQEVKVDTKYELTAANTKKLWSKFEEELLGRQQQRMFVPNN